MAEVWVTRFMPKASRQLPRPPAQCNTNLAAMVHPLERLRIACKLLNPSSRRQLRRNFHARFARGANTVQKCIFTMLFIDPTRHSRFGRDETHTQTGCTNTKKKRPYRNLEIAKPDRELNHK